jgi:hypothetical protein
MLPVSNLDVPKVWLDNLELIKSVSGHYFLNKNTKYSLSFQKQQLSLFVDNYILDATSKTLYKVT